MTAETVGRRAGRTLVDVVREKMRTRLMAWHTTQADLRWIRRDVMFHIRCHPRDSCSAAAEQLLSPPAVERKVRAACGLLHGTDCLRVSAVLVHRDPDRFCAPGGR